MYFGLMPFHIAGPANTARGHAADPFQRVVDSLCNAPAPAPKPQQFPALRKWAPNHFGYRPVIVLFLDAETALCLDSAEAWAWKTGEISHTHPRGNVVPIAHEAWVPCEFPEALYSH